MANRAYLLTVDDKSVTWSKDPQKEVLAEGINEIPVFWASLFHADDRQVDEYESDDGKIKVANWCVDADAAKARLKLLRPTIAALLDKRSRGLWEHWVEFMTAQACRLFKTNAAEVWSLDPAGYEDYWAVLLRAFEQPSSATMRAAIERNNLKYQEGKVIWNDREETTCKLAGAEHIRDLPWLQAELQDEDDPVPTLHEGPSIWDGLVAFAKLSGKPLGAAILIIKVGGDAIAGPGLGTTAITPNELVTRIMRYFQDFGFDREERADALRAWGIADVDDLVTVIVQMRAAGYLVALNPCDFHALKTAASDHELFGEKAG